MAVGASAPERRQTVPCLQPLLLERIFSTYPPSVSWGLCVLRDNLTRIGDWHGPEGFGFEASLNVSMSVSCFWIGNFNLPPSRCRQVLEPYNRLVI